MTADVILKKRVVELDRHRTGKRGITYSDEGEAVEPEYYFMDIQTYEEMGRPSTITLTIEVGAP